jgi:hypothetical protein
MKEVLAIIAGIVLTAQAPNGLSLFISCLWKKEKKMSFFAGLRACFSCSSFSFT